MSEKIKLKSIDAAFAKRLSQAEIAEAELAALKLLQEDISKFVVQVMAKNNIGFRAFAKENNLSFSMASKIIKGSGNLTLETIAQIPIHNGKKAYIVFSD